MSLRAAHTPHMRQINGLSVETSAGAAGAVGGAALSYVHCGALWGRPPKAGAQPCFLMRRFRRARQQEEGGKKSKSLKENSTKVLSWKRAINHG